MDSIVQIIAGPQEGKTVEITEDGEITFGRGDQNRVIMPFDGYISTRHATIFNRSGTLYLVDRGSSNGCFVNGKRLHPNTSHEIKDFFVLGSTPFMVITEQARKLDYYADPESLSANDWRDHPVFSHLSETANTHKVNLVDAPLVLMTMLDKHPQVIEPFLKAIDVPVRNVRKRYLDGDFFTERHEWLNKFIGFQKAAYQLDELCITPLVKRLMVMEAQSPHQDVAKFWETMVKLKTFSLMFPLLDWQRTETSWAPYFNATIKKRLSQSELRLLEHDPGRRFWVGLESVLSEGKVLLLHGGEGADQSHVLTRCFRKKGPLNLSLPDKAPRHFFDVQTYAYFQPLDRLNHWVKSIIAALKQPGLVCIDHVMQLLKRMNDEMLSWEPLIQAIHQRQAHLILTASSEHVKQLHEQIHGMDAINVERFQFGEHLQNINRHLERFERDIPFKLSTDVKTFLIDTFTETTQAELREFRTFLSYCSTWLKDVPEFALEGVEADHQKPLTVIFFKDMLTSWRAFVSARPNEGFSSIDVESSMQFPEQDVVTWDQPPPLPEPNDFSEDYKTFAVQLEQLVRTYAREAFRCSVTYSDRSKTLDQSGRLTEQEKLDELKTLIVAMLSSYQESFRAWFNRFWNELEPSSLQSSAKLGNNARKLWDEFKARAKKIDVSLAEDQFGEQAAKAFREAWKDLKRG